MFTVYLCNTALVKDRILIYQDDRSDEDELKLINPKLTMEVNQAGSFEFSIPVGNAGYDAIEPMISEILVYREDPYSVSLNKWRGDMLWYGRVVSMTTDAWKTKQIYCEGGLAYMNDIIASGFSTNRDQSRITVGKAIFTRVKNTQQPDKYNIYDNNDLVSNFRKNCLAGYGDALKNPNNPSNPESHFLPYVGFGVHRQIGSSWFDIWDVEPVIYQGTDDPIEYFYDGNYNGINYWNDYSILELLTNMVGTRGYYWVEKSPVSVKEFEDEGSLYVAQLHIANAYTSFNEERHQTFKMGENIIDYVKEDDMTDIYTAVHPYGTVDGEDFTTSYTFGSPDSDHTWNVQLTADTKMTLQYKKDMPGIIYRPDLVKRYGLIVKNIDVGTYVAREQLFGTTLDYFRTQNYLQTEVTEDGKTRIISFRELEIKAADMAMMGADVSMIRIMDPVRIICEPHNVDIIAHVTKIDIDLQSPENSVYTINSSISGSSINNGTGSSTTGGSAPLGLSYSHPRHTAHETKLYKIGNDNLGHVTDAQAVTKQDIVDLGIPERDTTYTLSKKNKTITLKSDNGKEYSVPDDDTTYKISSDGDNLVLTGSDGSTSSVDLETKGTKYSIIGNSRENNNAIPLTGSDGSVSYYYLQSIRKNFDLHRAPDNIAKQLQDPSRGKLVIASGFKMVFETANENPVFDLVIDAYRRSEPSGSKYYVKYLSANITQANIRQFCSVDNAQIIYNIKNLGDLTGIKMYAYSTNYVDEDEFTYTYTLYFALYAENDEIIDKFELIWPAIYYTANHLNNIYVSDDIYADFDATRMIEQTDHIPEEGIKYIAGDNITIDGNKISAKDTTYELATTTKDGLMSSADKSKLDNTPFIWDTENEGLKYARLSTVNRAVTLDYQLATYGTANASLSASNSYFTTDITSLNNGDSVVYSIFSGRGHTLGNVNTLDSACRVWCSIFAGEANFLNCTRKSLSGAVANFSFVGGQHNTIFDDIDSSILIGTGNNVRGVSNSVITGSSHYVEEPTDTKIYPLSCTVLAGYANTVKNATDSLVCGTSNIVDTKNAIIGGEFNIGKQNVLIEIGNGTGNNSRSDAFYVTTDGDIFCYGDETSLNAQIDANTAARHTHTNKDTLDKLGVDWWTQWGSVYENMHTHSNKNILDQLNQEQWTKINSAANKAHTHDNKETLDKIDNSAWLTVYSQTHTHDNKDILDATTASYTTAEKTKLSGIEAGAKKNVQSDWNATSGDAFIKNKPTIPDISGKQDKLTAGANITISGSTISAKDTTYSSKSAVSGGTDVSLVTTGEKAVWNAKTSNTGTITGIKMNGVSKGTSGVVDLGTVITAHQDISGKQDKSTAVTHTANTAVGSATKPVYVAANGAATAITHSINADVPANAKFTDTTYSDATQTAHGLMTAADKKKLDGMDLSQYLPLHGTAEKANSLSTGQMRSAYCHNDDATFSNGYVWFKIGTATLSGGYITITTTFLGICGYGKHALYTARIRLTSAGNAVESITFLESGRSGGMLTGLFRIVAINGEKSVTFELWAKGATRWEGTRVVILSEMNLNGSGQSNFWTLTDRGNADAKTAPTTGNMHVDSMDSSICATAVSASNATTWNGLTQDCDTYNSADTWLLVKNGNKIQHRLSYELKVKEASTLTDSGWGHYAGGVPNLAVSTLEYRKQGKIVCVSGYIKVSAAVSSIQPLTLPEGYRPPKIIKATAAEDSSAQNTYLVTISTTGALNFVGKTQGFFKAGVEYYTHITFFVN